VVTEALPRSLWSAVFVTGPAGDVVALMVVVHHVPVDGIGGAVAASGSVAWQTTGCDHPDPSKRSPYRFADEQLRRGRVRTGNDTKHQASNTSNLVNQRVPWHLAGF
jgi:hypothetical protein